MTSLADCGLDLHMTVASTLNVYSYLTILAARVVCDGLDRAVDDVAASSLPMHFFTHSLTLTLTLPQPLSHPTSRGDLLLRLPSLHTLRQALSIAPLEPFYLPPTLTRSSKHPPLSPFQQW